MILISILLHSESGYWEVYIVRTIETTVVIWYANGHFVYVAFLFRRFSAPLQSDQSTSDKCIILGSHKIIYSCPLNDTCL